MKGFSACRVILAAAVLGAGCVALEEVPGSRDSRERTITGRTFGPLDPGSKNQTGLHFDVSAYGSDKARELGDLAERQYARIMADTGLYSFIPKGLYPILVYANKQEYIEKTGLPDWSGGVSVGNSIYTFESPHAAGIIAHEMTHLIFYEYMGRADASLRWINEGLAVYEEEAAMRELGYASNTKPSRTYPFREMIHLAPLEERVVSVSDWYFQVGSVIRFMIETGGRIGFSQFIAALHSGRGMDEAIGLGFPGRWMNLDALEKDWQGGI